MALIIFFSCVHRKIGDYWSRAQLKLGSLDSFLVWLDDIGLCPYVNYFFVQGPFSFTFLLYSSILSFFFNIYRLILSPPYLFVSSLIFYFIFITISLCCVVRTRNHVIVTPNTFIRTKQACRYMKILFVNLVFGIPK